MVVGRRLSGVDDIGAVAMLQEPLRRRLYEFVASQAAPVSRNEAAEATGAQRTLVAFHLDKLAEAGLLITELRRVSGRTGPGAGRPAKLYRRAPVEVAVSLPARDHHTVAELLAEAAERARLDDELQAAARRRGAELAAGPLGSLGQASAVLAARGYEPYLDGETVRLRNCPFHALAESHPTLVCGMNLALLEGLLGGSVGLAARIDARPGQCCVCITKTV